MASDKRTRMHTDKPFFPAQLDRLRVISTFPFRWISQNNENVNDLLVILLCVLVVKYYLGVHATLT